MNREIFVQGMVDEFMKDKGGITSGMDAALQYVIDRRNDIFYPDSDGLDEVRPEFHKT